MIAPRYPSAAVRLALVREAPGISRSRVTIHNARAAYEAVAPVLSGLAHERFVALLLDPRKRLLSVVNVADGGLASCQVDPRVLFGAALVGGASSVIVAHCHPSGDPSPSADDVDLTRALVAAGRTLCLPILDHLIIGDGEFVSLAQYQPQLFGL